MFPSVGERERSELFSYSQSGSTGIVIFDVSQIAWDLCPMKHSLRLHMEELIKIVLAFI
jgi:hypothetical protein